MMVIHRQNGTVSWQMLLLIVIAAVGFGGGTLWLGAVSKQVEVNTGIIGKHSAVLDEVRQHDANTTARELDFERRLDRLERKVDKDNPAPEK